MILLAPVLTLLTACGSPLVRSTAQLKRPVRIVLVLPEKLPERNLRGGIYLQALHERLAADMKLVPLGAPDTGEMSVLLVKVAAHKTAAQAVQSAFTHTSTNALPSQAAAVAFFADDKMAAGINALSWDIGAGIGAAAIEEGVIAHHRKRLGFEPVTFLCEVALSPDRVTAPALVDQSGKWGILSRMQPLGADQAKRPEAIIAEEGRALAEQVQASLRDKGWKA